MTFGVCLSVCAIVSVSATLTSASVPNQANRVLETSIEVLPAIGSSASIGDRQSTLSTLTDSVLHDPALTIGTLPNGLRYYIRVSTTPVKRARLWLAVNAGAIQEDEDQRGFAHFLEHMAFNGTTHFPKNTLIDFIEQAGMQFGGDLNAYTNFDETVYQLTVPTDDPVILAQGLQVVYDWASGGITIDSSDVVNERGVVLGEWRMRNPDTASARIRDLQFGILFGDSSLYRKRFPIGLPKLLNTALPGPIQRFYRDWYRPDLMAVIAVGDFDPKAMEREIISRFGSISPASNPRPFTRPNTPHATTTPIVNIVEDRVRPMIEATWPAAELPQEPVASIRQQVLDVLVLEHVQRTLTKLSKEERRVFAQAGIRRSSGAIRPIGEQYTLAVIAMPDSLERAFVAALGELERVAQHGIPSEVLEREKANLLRRVQHAADDEHAIPSQELVKTYVQHFLTGSRAPLLSATQELAIIQEIYSSITPDATKKAAQFWRTSTPPTVNVTIPLYSHVQPPTRERMIALLDSVAHAPIPNAASKVQETRQISTIPGILTSNDAKKVGAGAIVNEQIYPTSDITVWTLSNGIRVLFKPTHVKSDELMLYAGSLGGTSRLPDNLFYTPGRFVGSLMTSSGGLGDLNRDELERNLNTTALQELRVAINAFNEEIAVTGSPKELETLFQLLHLQFTAPKIDSMTLAEWKRTGASSLTMSPNDKLAVMLANGEPRLTPPSQNTVNMLYLMDTAQAMAVYRDRFGDPSDFTFTITGAASAQQIKPLVEQYLATLPTLHRTEREQPRDLKIKPPRTRQDVRMESVNVPPEKAQNRLIFDGLLSVTPADALRQRRVLNTLSYILSGRLRNRLREEMAVTYGVGASAQFYQNPQPHYRFDISILTAPDRIDESVKNIWQIIDTIRTLGVTPEELTKAATIARRARENAMQDNHWWSAQMLRYDQAGISLDDIITADAVPVTLEDVKAAAQTYLTKDIYFQQTILPTKDNITKYEKELKKGDSDSVSRDKTAR